MLGLELGLSFTANIKKYTHFLLENTNMQKVVVEILLK